MDQIIRGLRSQGLRAIPLWFGTYKNGAMDYVPAWVKADTKRFPRVLDYGGRPIRVLSPHGQATLEADRKAYAELMKHLKEIDGNRPYRDPHAGGKRVGHSGFGARLFAGDHRLFNGRCRTIW